MLSSTVAGAIEQIDDALDVLAGVDLTALMPQGPAVPEAAPLPSHRLCEAFE